MKIKVNRSEFIAEIAQPNKIRPIIGNTKIAAVKVAFFIITTNQ